MNAWSRPVSCATDLSGQLVNVIDQPESIPCPVSGIGTMSDRRDGQARTRLERHPSSEMLRGEFSLKA